MPISLAIVDGHTLTRYGLRGLIAQQPDIEIVAEAGSAADAASAVAGSRPDVVTVDVALPDGNGLRLAREFRDRDAGLGIVLLTSRDEDDVLFRALETGVSAFVAKTAPVEEVLAAIRHAAVAASSFTAAGLAVALARRRAVQERLALSAREAEVLRLLSDGLSIPAIAMTMFISQSTTKTYVARLYEKLGVTNRAQALMTAVQFDLIGHEAGTDGRFARVPGGAFPGRAGGALSGKAGGMAPMGGASAAAAKRGAARATPAPLRRGQKVGLAVARGRAAGRPAPGTAR
jgi:DNA-binding NarL/FixJ family response regulator